MRSRPWWSRTCSSSCGDALVAPWCWWPLSSGSPTRLWEFALQIFIPQVNIRVDLLLFYPILLITGSLVSRLALPRERVTLGPEASCSIPVGAGPVREGAKRGYSGLDLLQQSRQLLLFGSSGT